MSSNSDLLAAQIQAALAALVAQGALQCEIPGDIRLERPKNRDHGDYASSIALAIAKQSGRPPREIAELLKKSLESLDEVASVAVAGPGFINITLHAASAGEIVRTIIKAGEKFGSGTALSGVNINVEFISANPTGPLHLGHTRWAAVGDALGRVLIAAGASVTREFYINDRGNQMDLFGASVQAAALGQAIPENGYQGGYINDLAQMILSEDPGIVSLSQEDQIVEFRERAYKAQLAQQRQVLADFGTPFRYLVL